MRAKLIEYAYPSSTTAVKAGFGKTGCWFIGLYKSETTMIRSTILANSYTADKDSVTALADSLPIPYNFMHKYHNA